MFAVIVYDIPSTKEGAKRSSAVRKICAKYGYHVQNSVFELDIDYSSVMKIVHDIEKIIDKQADSVRLYSLGKSRTENNVIIIGREELCESSDDCFML